MTDTKATAPPSLHRTLGELTRLEAAPLESVLNRLGRPAAVLGVGALVTGLVLVGDVRLTWSFSAFTVLVDCAITNLAALRLPASHRLYPKGISVLGLCACLFLAFQVNPQVWLTGLAVVGAGLLWHQAARLFRQ